MESLENINNENNPHEKFSLEAFANHILIFSGGFQDAYTYVVRNKVFANAQTGNIVLFSTYFLGGKVQQGIKYLIPLFAFMLGIFVADCIENSPKLEEWLHWKQSIVVFEAVIMLVVGFLPQTFNMLANCMISFACALQLQTFKKLYGNLYASTMCIGNMKSGVAALSSYIRTKSKAELDKFNFYFLVIFIFAIGAGFGGNFSHIFRERTIWISAILLLLCFLLLKKNKKE